MRTHAALQAAAAIGVAVAALATQLQGQLPSQGSAGCRLRVRTANMPVPRDLTRRTLKVGETERELFVHIPDTCRGKAAPVVFALHGGSASSGLAMHLKLELAPVAVREGFVVVCPSGTENCSREGGRTCASGRRLRRRRRPPEPRIAAHEQYGSVKPTPHKEEIAEQRPGEPPLKKMTEGDASRDARGAASSSRASAWRVSRTSRGA